MSARIVTSAKSADAADVFAAATSLLNNRDLIQAIDRLDLAESLGYPRNECASARWQCRMLLGEFENAWKESDRIAEASTYDPNRFWDGTSWRNRKVMLRCLHGLGDTIQFIRYAPLLRKICSSLTVQTHPELVRLLETVEGIDHVVSWGPAFPNDHTSWEMQMEVTELPFAFRTTLASIPASTPYFSIPEEMNAWAFQKLGNGTSLRVALVWESGPYNPARSIPAALLTPLLQIATCQFYCVHEQPTAISLAHYPSLTNIVENVTDVLTTASLLTHMDLVITVDTMVAHLAGALAIPVWIMLPATADWRWMIGRNDSPWYPRARLFRQEQAGDWVALLRQVQHELETVAAAS
jgi:hypothetical protein